MCRWLNNNRLARITNGTFRGLTVTVYLYVARACAASVYRCCPSEIGRLCVAYAYMRYAACPACSVAHGMLVGPKPDLCAVGLSRRGSCRLHRALCPRPASLVCRVRCHFVFKMGRYLHANLVTQIDDGAFAGMTMQYLYVPLSLRFAVSDYGTTTRATKGYRTMSIRPNVCARC